MTQQIQVISDEPFWRFQPWDEKFVGRKVNFCDIKTKSQSAYSIIYDFKPNLPMLVEPEEIEKPYQDGDENIPAEEAEDYIDETDKLVSEELDLPKKNPHKYNGNATIDEMFELCTEINIRMKKTRNKELTNNQSANDAVDDDVDEFMANLEEYADMLEIKLLGLIPNAGYDKEMFYQFRRIETGDDILQVTLDTYPAIIRRLKSAADPYQKKLHLAELVTCVQRFRNRYQTFNESVIIEPSNEAGIDVFHQPPPKVN